MNTVVNDKPPANFYCFLCNKKVGNAVNHIRDVHGCVDDAAKVFIHARRSFNILEAFFKRYAKNATPSYCPFCDAFLDLDEHIRTKHGIVNFSENYNYYMQMFAVQNIDSMQGLEYSQVSKSVDVAKTTNGVEIPEIAEDIGSTEAADDMESTSKEIKFNEAAGKDEILKLTEWFEKDAELLQLIENTPFPDKLECFDDNFEIEFMDYLNHEKAKLFPEIPETVIESSEANTVKDNLTEASDTELDEKLTKVTQLVENLKNTQLTNKLVSIAVSVQKLANESKVAKELSAISFEDLTSPLTSFNTMPDQLISIANIENVDKSSIESSEPKKSLVSENEKSSEIDNTIRQVQNLDFPSICQVEKENIVAGESAENISTVADEPKKSGVTQIVEPKKSGDTHVVDQIKDDDTHVVDQIKDDDTHVVDPIKDDDTHVVDPIKDDDTHVVDPIKDDDTQIVDPIKDDDTHVVDSIKDDDTHVVDSIKDDTHVVDSIKDDDTHVVEPKKSGDTHVVEPTKNIDTQVEKSIKDENTQLTKDDNIQAKKSLIDKTSKNSQVETADATSATAETTEKPFQIDYDKATFSTEEASKIKTEISKNVDSSNQKKNVTRLSQSKVISSPRTSISSPRTPISRFQTTGFKSVALSSPLRGNDAAKTKQSDKEAASSPSFMGGTTTDSSVRSTRLSTGEVNDPRMKSVDRTIQKTKPELRPTVARSNR